MGEIKKGSLNVTQGAQISQKNVQSGFFKRLLSGLETSKDLINQNETSLPDEGISKLKTLRVEDVAIPRADIVSVSSELNSDVLIKEFRESGYSRLPVFEDTLDNPIGMVHLKDLALKYIFDDKSEAFNFVELVRFDLEKTDSSLLVTPNIEILGKKVNAKTVDSISMSIACKNCTGKLYRARFYSDMGGESVLSEGIMKSDSIVVNNINLRGVNDGVLFATVFILDTSKVLLGVGKAEYKKDIIIPKSVLFKTNLSSFGKSNIDSLLLDIKVSEKNLQYNLVLTQNTVNNINSSTSKLVISFSPLNETTSLYTLGKFSESLTSLNIFLTINSEPSKSVAIFFKVSLYKLPYIKYGLNPAPPIWNVFSFKSTQSFLTNLSIWLSFK